MHWEYADVTKVEHTLPFDFARTCAWIQRTKASVSKQNVTGQTCEFGHWVDLLT